MPSKPPEETPRCSCGMVSEYCWDPDYEEWFVSLCWRCLEIQWMKDPGNPILKALLKPMHEDNVDCFIELLTDRSVMLETVTVKEFK